MMTANDFANQLGSGIYRIEFNKLDGTLRKMRATRMSAYVPSDKSPKTSSEVTPSQRSVAVFDLDLMEWRSVVVDNIVAMEGVD
jgi:hypothetical protein